MILYKKDGYSLWIEKDLEKYWLVFLLPKSPVVSVELTSRSPIIDKTIKEFLEHVLAKN